MRTAAVFAALLLATAAQAAEPDVAAEAAPGLRRWAWLPAGVGVLSTWAGAWLLVDAHSRAEHLANGPERFSPTEASQLQQTGERNAQLGVAALGLGAAALTGAVVLYAFGGTSSPAASISPTPNGVAASLSWTFP